MGSGDFFDRIERQTAGHGNRRQVCHPVLHKFDREEQVSGRGVGGRAP
jgi:hypothetical protein